MKKLSNYYKKYQMGGYSTLNWDAIMNQELGDPLPAKEKSGFGSNINWSNVGGTAVSLLSNISNIGRKLPSPSAPIMEETINPELVSYDADRYGLERSLRGINQGIDRVSSNSGRANAQKVANFSNYLQERSRLAQNERNINAGIRNQTNQFNTGIKARNVERNNSFRDALLARRLRQNQMDAENLSDIGNKLQLSQRDNRQMNLEEQKLRILPRVYNDSGVLDRNLLDLYNEQLGNYKFGGKLKRYGKN